MLDYEYYGYFPGGAATLGEKPQFSAGDAGNWQEMSEVDPAPSAPWSVHAGSADPTLYPAIPEPIELFDGGGAGSRWCGGDTITMDTATQGGTYTSTFTVTNTSGSSTVSGSLPWAVGQANAAGGRPLIAFNLADPSTPISLQQRLWINEAITIDGTTQPGYAGTPLVRIDGGGLPAIFTILGADSWHPGGGGATLAGLQLHDFTATAIATQPGADNVTIRDNHIGFYWDSAAGRWWRNFEAGLNDWQISNETSPVYDGYTQATGVGIQSSGNLIQDNVISGVHNGISIGYDFEGTASSSWGPTCWGNQVVGNMVGTTPDGSGILTNTSGADSYQPDPNANPFGAPAQWRYFGNNSDGIYLAALAQGTTIHGNLSSGNYSVGIELLHDTVAFNTISANRLGTNLAGDAILPNGELGIILSNGAHDNIVGGADGGNLVSGNYYAGIQLGGENSFRSATYNTVQGNLVGCDISGTVALGHQTTGIHLGTSDARLNVLEGNTVVGNEWGIYLEGAASNVVINNNIGVTATGHGLGNAQSGIVLDNASWTTVALNDVMYNGYGITGHDDWYFGVWNLNDGGGNRAYENSVTSNRTGINLFEEALPAPAIIDPTEGIFLPYAELNGTIYRGYFTELDGQEDGSGHNLWRLNPLSVEMLPAGTTPSVSLSFDGELGLFHASPLSLDNGLTTLNLGFTSVSGDPEGLYWRQR